METLEIHSKSFVIRWLEITGPSSITWQLKPLKRSINFGLYKHAAAAPRRGSVSSAAGVSLEEKLQDSGLEKVLWHGRCEPNELLKGSYQVDDPAGGMYAFVFDNTFSKNTAKTVLFSQDMAPLDSRHSSVSSVHVRSSVSGVSTAATEPSSDSGLVPFPGVGSHLNSEASLTSAAASSPGSGPQAPAVTRDRSHTSATIAPIITDRDAGTTWVSNERYMTGPILKKRRKKLQGYGRRHFSLDRKYGLLNYFLDQKSSFLRGSMPIRLCAITGIEKSREIIIDSGMEVWSLKALSNGDWKAWIAEFDALTKEAAAAAAAATPDQRELLLSPAVSRLSQVQSPKGNVGRALALQVGPGGPEHVQKLNDLIQRLETATQMAKSPATAASVSHTDPNSPVDADGKSSFWKRRASKSQQTPGSDGDSSSPELAAVNPNYGDVLSAHLYELLLDFRQYSHELGSSGSIDNILTQDVSGDLTPTDKRISLDATSLLSDDMFYDAHDDLEGVLFVDYDDESEGSGDVLMDYSEGEEGEGGDSKSKSKHIARQSLVPSFMSGGTVKSTQDGTRDLYPLPLGPVKRRHDIAEAKTTPPSLIGLLRKNVGKDLTTVAMPVSCNEPITILERLAEFVEYSTLLDDAVQAQNENERALLVATFAVSYLSSQRSKERALRKPFNPLLGETYELVREDRGFRLLAEKVSHRPPIMAIQVESAEWTIHYTARPHQKFWGKSVELTDSGPVRITFHRTGEVFQFLQPSTFLRNIIAGEKYVEPVGSATIESSHGYSATVEYKAGGMFAGRSEELTIKACDSSGRPYPITYSGKWTEHIVSMPSKKPVWKVGNLVPKSQKKYGFTEWAAELNDVTEIENGKVAPTDSRLRPDQRLYENGHIDEAEAGKLDLEERQRERRKVMETSGETWEPNFFAEESPNGFFVLKPGKENYWDRRREQQWAGLPPLW